MSAATDVIASVTYSSEVLTDSEREGSVTVWTGCPRCGVVQPIVATVHGRLVIEGEISELKPVFKAKARTHACGQMVLPLP